MAVKKQTVTFASLCNEVKQNQFRNIYVLQGEEPYYIDRLQQLIIDNALTPDQRDFNLTVYYGNNANVRDIISTCRQYPAFAERKVVVVREAQLIPKQPGHKQDLDLLAAYAEQPLATTVLVICHKGGALKSKPFIDQVKNSPQCAVLDSNKVRESGLPALITSYAAQQGCSIDHKAVSMLADHIGTDLARQFSEMDKLSMLATDHVITPQLIEKNIGISKDFNNFELEQALRDRDAAKAYRIVDYFERNPKNNPAVVSVAMLFSCFSAMLLAATARDRSPQALMAAIGTRSEWRLRQFLDANRNYSVPALVNIIGYLRECDTRSKGIGSRQGQYALLRELVYKITHA